jgi:hypothetical protein
MGKQSRRRFSADYKIRVLLEALKEHKLIEQESASFRQTNGKI